MTENAFEWDSRKAAGNLARHGVSFGAARKVFKDPFATEWLDESEDYGEERFIIIGMVGKARGDRCLHHEGRGNSSYLGAVGGAV